jgi:hypothetical protein
VLAPTGTIGLLMDCDTTGIEPDFALVKFKKLAGGGYFKIVNQSVPEALAHLGYNRGAGRRHRRVRERHEHLHGRAARQPLDAPREGPHRERDRQGREGAPGRVRCEPGALAVGHRQPRVRAPRRQARAVQQARLQPAQALRLHQRSATRQRRGRRSHDDRGRAAPQAPSTTRCSTAPTAAASTASATSRPWRTCA